MPLTRIAVPENATILKGSLRNLLDGSSAASVQHTANIVEKVHSGVLDYEDGLYSIDIFTQLLDPTRALVIFNRDYHIFRNSRGSDVDFIIVGFSPDNDSYIARLYNVQDKEQVTATKVTNIKCDSIEELLSSIWGDLSTSFKRSNDEGKAHYKISAVVARELAFQFLTFNSCDIQVMGESLVAENENEFIDIFRKVCTERLIMKGAYIQSTADSIETAFRKIAYE